MAKCPECGTKLNVTAGIERGDQIVCKACGRALGVLNVRPLELEAVAEIRRRDLLSDLDWEDDDELDDEEDEGLEDLGLDDEDWG